ncbi:unnamed protein product [Leptidea sinapis]|uniref:Cytochrome b5 heme-binding domain-containing protein n=1 Tax=Leptidea sinapis TaxID=189913 RepID=A0A5E4QKS8_9NEOP|nr:unnamed protein product [Leptidea sinapis]
MQDQVKLFTREELKARNTETDCILIIHNGVYNVTEFLEEHPGGLEVLMELAGKDASEAFEDIGELVEADRTASKASFATTWNNDQPQEPNNAWSAWLVPLLLGVAATFLYRFLFL